MKYQGKHLAKKQPKQGARHKGRSRTYRGKRMQPIVTTAKTVGLIALACVPVVVLSRCDMYTLDKVPQVSTQIQSTYIPCPVAPIDFSVRPETSMQPMLTSRASVRRKPLTEEVIRNMCYNGELLTVEDLNSWPEAYEKALNLVTYEGYTGEMLPEVLGKIVTREIGGLTDSTAYSTFEQERAAVVWTICNRAEASDSSKAAAEVFAQAVAPGQFAYYTGTSPAEGTEEIAVDVLCRWVLEDYVLIDDPIAAAETVGRVLPREYIYFGGDGAHNHFRKAYDVGAPKWQWTLTDPYLEVGKDGN